jgi:hypothetical protein
MHRPSSTRRRHARRLVSLTPMLQLMLLPMPGTGGQASLKDLLRSFDQPEFDSTYTKQVLRPTREPTSR